MPTLKELETLDQAFYRKFSPERAVNYAAEMVVNECDSITQKIGNDLRIAHYFKVILNYIK